MGIEHIKYADRDEWLAIRRQYIGGSDAGSIVGMNPYKSAYTLWAEKTGKAPEFDGNLTTEVGAYLEEFVAKMFEKETDKKVKRHNATMVNDKYPYACANADRLVVGERALLEIKTTNSLPNMKKIKGGEFPDAWYCQMTHYLAVSELDKAYLAVLVNCRDFYIFELDRDEEEIAALMTAEAEFARCVINDTPPAVDGLDSTSDTLCAIYSESDDSEVNLMAYEKDLREYMSLNAQIKSLKALADEKANSIKAFIGNAGRGISDGFKVSWLSSERTTFDYKSFMSDRPDIDYTNYIKKTSTRTFRVNERK